MEEVGIIGIDLAKRSFRVHGARADGSVAHRGKLSRGRLLSFLASQPKCTVAMEACAGAHHWGREILPLGHEVRLVPPIHVKPFVKRHKNDAAGRGGDHGGGATTDHALRRGQDGGAAGTGDAVPHARPAGAPANADDQRAPGSPCRARRRGPAGPGPDRAAGRGARGRGPRPAGGRSSSWGGCCSGGSTSSTRRSTDSTGSSVRARGSARRRRG